MTGDEVDYLDLDDVIRLHGLIFGVDGAVARDQLRDPGALESAINRPANHAAYQGADLASQAAVLAHGIAQSQCFLDGDKRTALIAMTTFPALNGWDVGVPDARLAELILGFAHGVRPDQMADELRPSLTTRP
ncbi:MAG: type II toxin-antitoxin system death-on-curing family toxin [Candidatus Dormibacteria bacterium]